MQQPLREDPTRIATRSSDQGSVQNHARTCTRPSACAQDLLTRISAISCLKTCTSSCKDLLEDFIRISARSSRKDTHKIVQGPLGGLQQDHDKVFSQGPVQDNVQKFSSQETVQDHAKTSSECFIRISARSSHKDVYKIVPGSLKRMDLYKIFLQGSLLDPVASISTRSCHKDRHKIMQRPLERISSGSLEDLLAGTQILYESYFVREFTGKMPRPKMESHTLCDNSQ